MLAALVVLNLAGLVLPAWGLVGAYRKTTQMNRTLAVRSAKADELLAWQNAETSKLSAAGKFTEIDAQNDLYRQKVREAGLADVTMGDFDRQILLGGDKPDVLGTAVRAARNDLWLIGVGILCATAANVWSLFV